MKSKESSDAPRACLSLAPCLRERWSRTCFNVSPFFLPASRPASFSSSSSSSTTPPPLHCYQRQTPARTHASANNSVAKRSVLVNTTITTAEKKANKDLHQFVLTSWYDTICETLVARVTEKQLILLLTQQGVQISGLLRLCATAQKQRHLAAKRGILRVASARQNAVEKAKDWIVYHGI